MQRLCFFTDKPKAWLSLLAIVAILGLLASLPSQSAQAAGEPCRVVYTTNSWGSGFTADIKIINDGTTAIQGWTLTYSYANGQQITSAWNATVSQAGGVVTASNPSSHWNGMIPAGGSASFGVQGTYSGTNADPADFVLNGVICMGGTVTGTPTATDVPPTPITPTATATSVTPTQSTPTFTHTPTNTHTPFIPTTPPGGCAVVYTANSWGSGFTADIKITNNGAAAIQGWTLTYSYANGQQITSSWNATVSQSGANVMASNPSSHWNGTIPVNGSASFGIQGTQSGTNTNPADFVLNGMACNGGPIPTTHTPTSTVTTGPSATPTQTQTHTATATGVTPTTPVPTAGRQMENLNRGLARTWTGSGNFVSWRLLGTDPESVAFNLYRGSTKVNSSPITDSTNYFDAGGSSSSSYTVRSVLNGQEQVSSESSFNISGNYHVVPLQVPAGGTSPDGVAYAYSANDASVGDLDGDGQYEIVLKWDPSNSKDNSQSGYTGNVYLDAYELNGIRLWRIDLGRNIRAGAHYTQFIVYDLDGDGKSEVACKTADGTRDGVGIVIGNANADYRNSSGYILSGPEFLTIFNGQSGAAMATTNYVPARGTVSDWGDNYGNRVDRFLAGVAYVDGTRPSLIMARGYYTRSVIVAWDWRNGSLTQRWTFDTNNGYGAYTGQGNHQLSVADADGDGRDEIIYGAMAVNDNGAGMWNSGYGHGDAMHVSDLNPNRAGLEVWGIHEGASTPGSALLDAATGATLWKTTNADVGRGIAVDIDPRYAGAEAWGGTDGLRSITNAQITSATPSYANFAVWWDGDLLRELLDGDVLDKWNYSSSSMNRLYTLYNDGVTSNNGTKKNPALVADIFGDWREEIILRTTDSAQLRIFSTTTVTTHRLYTLMHDPIYRIGIAWQNVAYNQPPHTSYFLGEGMAVPPRPNIYVTP